MKRFFKENIYLWMVLLVALLLRVFMWDMVPARLTVDEMSIGYNSYSILKTGKDEWGRTMPLYFQAFGDFKLPLYIYLTIPFVAVMGMSIISIKIVSLISGMVFVYMIYKISELLFDKRNIAIISSLLASLSPWGVHLSRQGLESNLALALFAVGVCMFLLSLKDEKNGLAIASGILMGSTMYAYVAYRMLVVLVVLWMGIVYYAKHKNLIKKLMIGLGLTILPLLPSLFSSSGIARAKHVSIFTDPGVEASVIDNRSFCFLVNPKLNLVCRIIFNKPSQIFDTFVKNYVSFLSPEFLFLNGDENKYLANPGFGEYFWFTSLFLIMGVYAWAKKKDRNLKFILGILLLSPVAGAMAGRAQMVRSSMMLLPLTLVLGYGVGQILKIVGKWKYKQIVGLVGAGAAMYFVVTYFVSYFVIYPTKYDEAAYQMPMEVVDYLKQNRERFDLVYVNDYFSDAHIAIAYFLNIDPSWYMENVVRPENDGFGFSHPVTLGKYNFGAMKFESVFCKNRDLAGVYITDRSHEGYFDEEYKNFSGVHTQAKIVTFEGMRAYMNKAGLSIEEVCGETGDN